MRADWRSSRAQASPSQSQVRADALGERLRRALHVGVVEAQPEGRRPLAAANSQLSIAVRMLPT